LEERKSFTLLELLVAITIISILATLGFVNYIAIREKNLDKDAHSSLKLLCAAEKSYEMDWNTYYPSVGSQSDIPIINSNLKVSLSNAANRGWNYTVWSTGCSRATRNVTGGRSWFLIINDADETPDSGAGCP